MQTADAATTSVGYREPNISLRTRYSVNNQKLTTDEQYRIPDTGRGIPKTFIAGIRSDIFDNSDEDISENSDEYISYINEEIIYNSSGGGISDNSDGVMSDSNDGAIYDSSNGDISDNSDGNMSDNNVVAVHFFIILNKSFEVKSIFSALRVNIRSGTKQNTMKEIYLIYMVIKVGDNMKKYRRLSRSVIPLLSNAFLALDVGLANRGAEWQSPSSNHQTDEPANNILQHAYVAFQRWVVSDSATKSVALEPNGTKLDPDDRGVDQKVIGVELNYSPRALLYIKPSVSDGILVAVTTAVGDCRPAPDQRGEPVVEFRVPRPKTKIL
ncbi:hypothetical protein EVAR_4351_1 [Eumeta japonica]|uniref:Uncharacterized protein n=1 Tax=Eumeta variegata TaxID=151549 RepID=A0A4C1VBP5_EUMVA|nr:hypothetical protein EVAR_4351_1 [Eumeta japonica]